MLVAGNHTSIVTPSAIATTGVRVGDEATATGELLGEDDEDFVDVDDFALDTHWYRLHYDSEFARKQGSEQRVIDGQVFGALFARAALDWAGPRPFVTRLTFKMKSMAFAGETSVRTRRRHTAGSRRRAPARSSGSTPAELTR
jgi:hypothetical protein